MEVWKIKLQLIVQLKKKKKPTTKTPFLWKHTVPQGLGDEELKKSLETLQKMASSLNADMTVLRERDGVGGKVAEVLIRR